jgi:predicted nuclease of predicted toxin-antitoxin system
MKFVIDVNLSRKWLHVLLAAGLEAVYWSDFGNEEDGDDMIMAWARDNNSIVLTCDLDFNAMLAASGASKPSVVQLRPGKHRPELLIGRLALALKAYHMHLDAGALLTIDFGSSRVSRLPLVEIEYGTEI